MKWLIKEIKDCTEANDICKKFEKVGAHTGITMRKRTPRDHYIFVVNVIIGGKAND